MLGSRGLRRSEVARARLDALRPAWVPTPEMVSAAFATDPEPEAVQDPESEGAAWEVEPSSRPRLRVDAPAARGVLVLAVGAIIGSAVVLALGWPRGEAAPASVATPIISGGDSRGLVPSGTASVPTTGQVVVDVAGLVHKPGVVELPAGSRVIDALDAAGGVRGRGDTTGLNLAQLLTDGQQVLVTREVRPGAPDPGGTPAPSAGSSLVNINTATLEQLDTLPGIGPVLAQAIVDWRTQNGSFTAVEQLTEVSGIGDATYADLQPLVTV